MTDALQTLASRQEEASEDRELKRMNETLAARTKDVFAIMAGARRICKRKYQRSPNWVLAIELFGLGSTYAFALCRRYGIDPDATTIKRPSALRSQGEQNHE